MAKIAAPPEDFKYIFAYINHLIDSEQFEAADRYLTDFLSPANKDRANHLLERQVALKMEQAESPMSMLGFAGGLFDLQYIWGAGLFTKAGGLIDQKKQRGKGTPYFRKAITLIRKCPSFKDNSNAHYEYVKALVALALNTSDPKEKCKYLKAALKTPQGNHDSQLWDVARQEYEKTCR